jgi:hypothetical protein
MYLDELSYKLYLYSYLIIAIAIASNHSYQVTD